MPRIAVLHFDTAGDFALSDGLADQLIARFPALTIRQHHGAPPPSALIADAEVYVGVPDDATLAAMPRLRWLQLPSAGCDGWPARLAGRPEVVLTTANGVFGVPAAEHALALLLAFCRDLPTYVRQQDRQHWAKTLRARELDGAIVAILGFGDIGRELAVRLAACGSRVLALSRRGGVAPPGVAELHAVDAPGAIDGVLAQADFVVACLPATPATVGLLDARRLALMRPGAVLINVGRGSAVDEVALIAALERGHLGGAGLDVTTIEPLPAASPLWRLPQVLITSHSVNTAPGKHRRRFRLLDQQFTRWLAGDALLNVVDRQAGY